MSIGIQGLKFESNLHIEISQLRNFTVDHGKFNNVVLYNFTTYFFTIIDLWELAYNTCWFTNIKILRTLVSKTNMQNFTLMMQCEAKILKYPLGICVYKCLRFLGPSEISQCWDRFLGPCKFSFENVDFVCTNLQNLSFSNCEISQDNISKFHTKILRQLKIHQ